MGYPEEQLIGTQSQVLIATKMSTRSIELDVIIPVFNDSSGIQRTAESIKNQLSKINNVIIVDNGSTDASQEIINKYSDGVGEFSFLIQDDIQGSYAARNTGIKESNGDILAFLDADETVDEDWLDTALGTMHEQDVDYLGCNVKLSLPEDTLVGRYNARTGFPVEQYLSEEHYAPTCAVLVKREVFEDIGRFDARLISGGDREFGERVYEAGYDQGYATDATVYHPARTSLESLAKKNFRVGRGFCQKQRYYPERYGDPGIPPRPSGPSGDEDKEEPDSVFTRLAFALLSVAMLACRGLGYYYEFVFGEKRDDIPAPTR